MRALHFGFLFALGQTAGCTGQVVGWPDTASDTDTDTDTTGDVTAPTVVATMPEDAEEDVALDAAVVATFSEPMEPPTITDGTFELAESGGAAVTGEVVYDAADERATFTPDDLLLEDTTYTASISTAAADLAGNGLEQEYVWTFTTEEPLFLPPPVDLGSLSSFVAVAGVSIDNSGPTHLNGDVGLFPGTACVACMPPDMYVTGTLYVNDPEGVAEQAKADLTAALIEAQAYASDGTISADLDGQVLPPGVYTSASTMEIAVDGTLTLDAEGDPDAFWIVQVGSGLTVNSGATVDLVNGARAANVFWAVGSSSTINANAQFQGTVLAQASNSVGTNASVTGRLLCTEGSITLLSNSITLPPL